MSGQTSWKTAGTITAAADIIVSKCKEKAIPRLTSIAINEGIAQFVSALQSHRGDTADAVHLGKANGNAGCGNGAAGACVDYTEKITAKQPGNANDIDWYEHMERAAAVLAAVDQARREVRDAQQKLEELKEESLTLYATLQINDDLLIQSQTPTIPTQMEKKKEEDAKKECNKIEKRNRLHRKHKMQMKSRSKRTQGKVHIE
uniref:Variant surface glycoprotein n=1 Tax=Trypanosoma brucei TaxID=5691 RepID=A0A1V0FZX1_9TRYP|nr:variant surface glycoprotein [Trypanosoma brucei]